MSDASQGPGWWQASDGKWYAPDTPPAPGWWRASDGNWYPPADEPSPDTAPASPEPLAPSADATPAPTPAAAAEPPPAAPATPAPTTTGGSGKGPLLAVGIVVVLLLVAAVAFVATRKSDSGVATGGGSSSSGQSSGGDGNGGQAGQPNEDLSAEMPSPDLKLADDVVVVDSKQGAMFKGFSDDGAGMLLDPAAPGLDKLEAGDVLILSGITTVRAASVEKGDQGVVVGGEPVTLPEVIVDGDLSWKDVSYDPEQMRLRVWDDGGGSSSSGGSGGSGGGSSGGAGGGSTDDSIVDDGGNGINDGLSGISSPGGPVVATPAVAPLAVTSPGASPVVARMGGVEHTFALPTKQVSGTFSDMTWTLDYEPTGGSGHHLKVVVDSKGDLDGTITVDVNLGSLSTSGAGKVDGKQVKNFDFDVAELGGDAKVTVNLRSTKNTTSVMTPPFFQLPFSIEFPALVGGVPFTLSLTGTLQVQLSMALANATLNGEAAITYGGDAGLHFDGGKLSVNGKRQQDAEDLVKTVNGLANGPVGVVVTAELPKVGFGFGFLQTGAGVYLSNGMVVQQSILPQPAACTGFQVAYVLAAGIEAKFLGKEFDIGRKAVVDKRWDYSVPKTAKCNPDG